MFMIVSKDDFPVFELPIGSIVRNKDHVYLYDFILHSSLDVVDNVQWATSNMYLKTIDKYNDLSVACLITPSNARFLLLHEGKGEESIKNFFNEIYDLFVKVVMNPFYESNSKITLQSFEDRVKGAARKFL
mmetsp:Transcript_2883/g.2706  ORF Transcript_2883/g.2706 Transcript_2883/m.2706 type:complete len:131 (-) Transcript_2883:39-431(-)